MSERPVKLKIMESETVKAAAVEVARELKAFEMLRRRLRASPPPTPAQEVR